MRLVPFAALGAAVWVLALDLHWPVRVWTVFLVAGLPVLTLEQLRMARDDSVELPRQTAYVSSIIALWTLAGLGLAAAVASGFTPRLMGLVVPPPARLLAWTISTLASLLALLLICRAARIRETRLLEQLLPRTASERVLFVLLSVSAGVAEELMFRGILLPALVVAFGSTWAAAVVSSIVFGFVHTYQGVAGTIRAGILGLLLAVSFLATGSLIPAMLAHGALNILAGIWLADWLLRR